MNVEELRQFVVYIANKEQSGNSFAPFEYNRLLQVANIDFFNKMYGLYQEYQIDSPTPRVSWEVSQYVTDALAPFKVRVPSAMVASGQLTKPSDYYHHSSLRYSYTTPGKCATDPAVVTIKNVELLKDAEIGNVTGNSNVLPSANVVYGCYFNTYIQIFPSSVTSLDFTYLRKPVTPFWNSTLVSGVPTYNSVGSIQIEFPEFCHKDIAMIILSYAGINLREEQLTAYAQTLKQTGV